MNIKFRAGLPVIFLMALALFAAVQNIYAQKPEDRKPGSYMNDATKEANQRYERQKQEADLKRSKEKIPNNINADKPVTTPVETYTPVVHDTEEPGLTEEEIEQQNARMREIGDARDRKDRADGIKDDFYYSYGDPRKLKYMYMYKMDDHYSRKDYDGAIRCYDSLMIYINTHKSSDPDWPEMIRCGNKWVVNAYFKKQEYLLGLKCFNADYEDRRYANWATSLYFINLYREAYEHLPDHKEFLDTLKNVCAQWMSFTSYYGSQVQEKEGDEIARKIYVYCELELGNYKSAEALTTTPIEYLEKEMKRGFVVFNLSMNYYYYRAMARYKLGDLKKAKKDCERSLEINEAIGATKVNELLALIKAK